MIVPTMRQLQYLTALRDLKSFSKAAERCLVSQPSLSAGIKDLEHILGHPVIDRSRRTVIFTALGRDIVREADEVLECASGMMIRASASAKPMSGVMRLGVIPTIAPYILPNVLSAVRTAYPDLELQLFEGLSDDILTNLEDGVIDVALIAFPFDTPNMVQEILFEEPFYLAVPKGYALDTSDTITTKDLDPGELLLLEDGHCLSDHALSACKIQMPKRRKAYSATSLATLLQMVSNGYGITLVPDMAVRAGAMPKNIDLVPFATPKPTRQIGLVWRAGPQRSDDFKTLGALVQGCAD